MLREDGAIAPLVLPPLTTHERIFKEFDAYLRSERGLALRSTVRHLPVIRRFLHEVCSGDAALCKINEEDVIRYVERHAQDWSPGTGKAMCWSLPAFIRYLHHRGLNARPFADCVHRCGDGSPQLCRPICLPLRCGRLSTVATERR
ncbi:hypothetical protein [Bradyrhizobium sp. STM 3561]|uniref:hypothetical protein n=1 Tax=Bradyrhizobium sp. STM 3561 TaxID=578923 RepID=UPI003890A5A7